MYEFAVNTVTAITNALYQIRENNNDNKVDRTHCIDIDKLPDKTETFTSATMPASGIFQFAMRNYL